LTGKAKSHEGKKDANDAHGSRRLRWFVALPGLGLFLCDSVVARLDCWQAQLPAVIEFANVAGMQEGQWFDIVALMWALFQLSDPEQMALKSIWKLPQLT